MKQRWVVLGALALLAGAGTASAADCPYSKPVKAWVNGAGLQSLSLRLGSADLAITGVAGQTAVEVSGTACATSKAQLAGMTLTATRNGSSATVVAENHGRGLGSLFAHAGMRLTARVPAALAVAIDSGSGDVNAAGLASLDFHSGSGDLVAHDIAGKLGLQLGSADVRAQRVGSVALGSTGSGDVTVTGVAHDVVAGHSGSGDLAFSDVKGNVSVDSTGSGDVTLASIGGNVAVGATGSGDVQADGVGGNFTVRATGSGDIRPHGVKGKVSVPRND